MNGIGARARRRAGAGLAAGALLLSAAILGYSRPTPEPGAAAAGGRIAVKASPAVEAPAPAAQAPERNPLRNAYFGDFHVHSSWSLDAYVLGGNRDDPSLAYRFGRGEEVTKADGTVHRLRVPLDFMAVTDHDTWLGQVHLCNDAGDAAYDTPTCERIRANDWFGTGAFEGRGRRPPDICGQGEAAMTAANRC